jgi:hypothetical protein
MMTKTKENAMVREFAVCLAQTFIGGLVWFGPFYFFL